MYLFGALVALVLILFIGEKLVDFVDAFIGNRTGYHPKQHTTFNRVRWVLADAVPALLYVVAIFAVAYYGQWWEGAIALVWFGYVAWTHATDIVW